ncbi:MULTISPECIES: putative glycolipid-binding domain-containing protein [Rhodomicrobium]|uniref:putative glycolipid-binding domain-containing protein n=1 Tax=Rhodomicrobium TaxID=1068 RepID=UPI000B4B2A73|nr:MULTISPECIES: putative glycolipid-binding domain-containing protein [Rhodomicrobium]
MRDQITARWTDWQGRGLEHLVLRPAGEAIVAYSALIPADAPLAAGGYRMVCDAAWRVRRVEVALLGADAALAFSADGAGNWTGDDGRPLPHLSGAIDVDITATPFTNTLPIRRCGLDVGQSVEIAVAYVSFPELRLTADPQRYTRLDDRRYRFEALASGFAAEIEVDADGLVTDYPGLFRRVA